MKTGIIQWFDGEEGMVLDLTTFISYYAYKDCFKDFEPKKGMKVKFTLYTNLYMSQVDSCAKEQP